MKKGLLIVASIIFFLSSQAQVAVDTVTPYLKISLNVSLLTGTCDLAGVDTVYLHSGLGTSPNSTWQHIVGHWGLDDGVGVMTIDSSGHYSICFNVFDYYAQATIDTYDNNGGGEGPLLPGETPNNIGLVFRDSQCPLNMNTGKLDCEGALTGKDETCEDIFIWNLPSGVPNVTDNDSGAFTAVIASYVTECPAVGPPLSASITSGRDSICQGDTTLLTGSASGGSGIYNYGWSNGDTAQSVIVNGPGNYILTVTDQSTGQTASGSVLVNALATAVTPTIGLSITGGSQIVCSGASVAFIATSTNGGTSPIYNFIVDGSSVQDSSSPAYSSPNLDSSETVTCVLTSNAICALPANVTSDTLVITVSPNPEPIISQVGDSLLTTGIYSSYQWFWNDTAVSNADLEALVASQTGNYTVFVIDSNGCTDTSGSYYITISGITMNNFVDMKLYPNPNNGSFVLQSNNCAGKEIIIYDVTGQILDSEFIESDEQIISLKNPAAGAYTLQIKGEPAKVMRFIVAP